jgi:hypothetical protein
MEDTCRSVSELDFREGDNGEGENGILPGPGDRKGN